MSAHLNVSGQVGGYNLENNTDPEFFNSVYNIFSKDAPESETESRHVDWLLPDRRIAEDTTVINYNMSKQKNKFTDLASIRIWGSVILEKKTRQLKTSAGSAYENHSPQLCSATAHAAIHPF